MQCYCEHQYNIMLVDSYILDTLFVNTHKGQMIFSDRYSHKVCLRVRILYGFNIMCRVIYRPYEGARVLIMEFKYKSSSMTEIKMLRVKLISYM